MVHDYHVAFAVLGSVAGLLSFLPYFRDILRGTTKPHPFTWFVWTLLTGITFFIQVSEGAGVGAWVTGVESLSCATVAVFAYTRGEREITRLDWLALFGALFAIALWLLVHQPLLAVVLVVCADGLGFVPTFRKSYWKPQEETALQYATSALHWILAVLALESFVLVNWLYPAAISLFDMALVTTLLIRRKQLATST